MYKNEFEKNKRVYPVPYTTSTQTATPPAATGTSGGKGPGQDGWESMNGVVEGPVQALNVGAKIKCRHNNMTGKIAVARNTADYYQVNWENGHSYGTHVQGDRWLVHKTEIEPIDTASNDMDNEGPIQRTKRYITKAEAIRMRKVPRWPDSGIAMPQPPDISADASSNVIFPRETGEDGVVRDKKIHQFGLNEAFDATSIDTDDANDWGGLTKMEGMNELEQALAALSEQYDDEEDVVNRDAIGADAEDNKYGPGNYPTEEDYRTEGFYENLFSGADKGKQKLPFTWLIPNVLAAGPHPIFTSHLDNLEPLLKAGIKAVVTVHDKPLDLKYFEDTKLAHLFVATVEGYASDLQRICKFIATQEMLGNPVLVHSFSGKGRAATVLAAYLMHKNWLTGPEAAIAYVRQHYHKDAIETTFQEDALMKFSLDA